MPWIAKQLDAHCGASVPTKWLVYGMASRQKEGIIDCATDTTILNVAFRSRSVHRREEWRQQGSLTTRTGNFGLVNSCCPSKFDTNFHASMRTWSISVAKGIVSIQGLLLGQRILRSCVFCVARVATTAKERDVVYVVERIDSDVPYFCAFSQTFKMVLRIDLTL